KLVLEAEAFFLMGSLELLHGFPRTDELRIFLEQRAPAQEQRTPLAPGGEGVFRLLASLASGRLLLLQPAELRLDDLQRIGRSLAPGNLGLQLRNLLVQFFHPPVL